MKERHNIYVVQFYPLVIGLWRPPKGKYYTGIPEAAKAPLWKTTFYDNGKSVWYAYSRNNITPLIKGDDHNKDTGYVKLTVSSWSYSLLEIIALVKTKARETVMKFRTPAIGDTFWERLDDLEVYAKILELPK